MSAPTGGWNPTMNPWEMPNNQSPAFTNLLIADAAARMRGAIVEFAQCPSSNQLARAVGFVSGYNSADYSGNRKNFPWLMVGITGTTGGNLPWESAQQSMFSSSRLGTTNLGVTPAGAMATVSGGTTENIVGPRWIAFDGLLYGLSLSSSVQLSNSAGSYNISATNLLTLPLTQGSTLAAPTVLGGASPRGGIDLTSYQNRIWILGGADTPAGSTVHSPSTLYYTIPGNAGLGGTVTDWRDPTSGLTNYSKVQVNDSDSGMALGRCRSGLVIFFRRSIWLLRGSTTSNYTLTQLSKDVGCIDPRSVVEVDQGIYFMSDNGLCMTDGVRVTNVSGALTMLLSSLMAGAILTPCVSVIPLSGNYLAVSYGVPNGTPGYIPYFSALFNRTTGAWSQITSAIWAADTLQLASNGFSGQLHAPNYAPHWAFSVGGNTVTALEFMRAQNTQTSIIVPAYALSGPNALVHDVSLVTSNAYEIPARWRTKFAPVVGANARKRGQAKRYFLDSMFACPAGSTYPNVGWTVTPLDTNRGVMGSSVTTAVHPSSGGSSTYVPAVQNIQTAPVVDRTSQDFVNEVDDVWFDIASPSGHVVASSSVATTGVAELYGLGLEYQPARELR